MAYTKSLVLITLLAAAAIAVPMAQAQPVVGALLPPLLQILRIQGVVSCTRNGNIGVGGNGTSTGNGTSSTPVIPNAPVQLQCGGNVVSTTVTDLLGQFSILLDPMNIVLPNLLSGCRLVVIAPLVTCNANLPSVGGLASTLQNVESTVVRALTVTNIIPSGFTTMN